MIKCFKRHRDNGFFDPDIRLSKLSKLGDPLEKLTIGIDFDIFRGLLEEKLSSRSLSILFLRVKKNEND